MDTKAMMYGSEAFSAARKQRMKVMTMMWVALTASIFIYAIIGYFIAETGTLNADAQTGAILRMPLYVAAAVVGLVSLSLRLFLSSTEWLQTVLSKPVDVNRLSSNLQTGIRGSTPPEDLEVMDKKEHRILGLLSWYFGRFILILALNEAIVIFGLVLTLVTSDLTELVPFFAAGLLLNAIMFGHPKLIAEEADRILSCR